MTDDVVVKVEHVSKKFAKLLSKGHIEHDHSLSKTTNPTSSVRCVRNET
jgi:hypothetical protein